MASGDRAELLDEPADSFGEALSYFPATAYDDPGPHEYLNLLERAATTTPIPVIASLNGVTPGSWAEYAWQMQDAGAAAIELNMYDVPGDPRISGRLLEQRHIEVLQRVKDAVTVPVAVKLSPFYSSIGEMAQLLDKAGADALVLFNRFLQPDIDAEELAVMPRVTLSSQLEGRLPRMCIALLRGSQPWLACSNVRSRIMWRQCVVAARRHVGRGNTDATAQFERFRSLALPPTHAET